MIIVALIVIIAVVAIAKYVYLAHAVITGYREHLANAIVTEKCE